MRSIETAASVAKRRDLIFEIAGSTTPRGVYRVYVHMRHIRYGYCILIYIHVLHLEYITNVRNMPEL